MTVPKYNFPWRPNIVKITHKEFVNNCYVGSSCLSTFYNEGYDADGQKWQWFSKTITLEDGMVLDGGDHIINYAKIEG